MEFAGMPVMKYYISTPYRALTYLCSVQLNRELERCVALVNRVFSKHNILVGVDDRGRLSCHKVNLCFIYFKTQDCVVSDRPLG